MAYTAADIILMCVGSIAPSTLKIPCRQTVGDCLCKHALVLPSWREGLFLVSVLTQTEVMNTRGMRWKTIVKASRQNQKNINNLFIWQTLLSRVIWHIILTNNIRRILQLCSSSRFFFFFYQGQAKGSLSPGGERSKAHDQAKTLNPTRKNEEVVENSQNSCQNVVDSLFRPEGFPSIFHGQLERNLSYSTNLNYFCMH